MQIHRSASFNPFAEHSQTYLTATSLLDTGTTPGQIIAQTKGVYFGFFAPGWPFLNSDSKWVSVLLLCGPHMTRGLLNPSMKHFKTFLFRVLAWEMC